MEDDCSFSSVTSDRRVMPNRKRKGRNTANEDVLEGKQQRSHFSQEDDRKLIEFLLQNLQTHQTMDWKGNQLWKRAVEKNITQHSQQAMRDRVKRHLVPTLDELPEEIISEEEREMLEKLLKDTKELKMLRACKFKQNRKVAADLEQVKVVLKRLDAGQLTDSSSTSDSNIFDERMNDNSLSIPVAKQRQQPIKTRTNIDDDQGPSNRDKLTEEEKNLLEQLETIIGYDTPILDESLKGAINRMVFEDSQIPSSELKPFIHSLQLLITASHTEKKLFIHLLWSAHKKKNLSNVLKRKDKTLLIWKSEYTHLLLKCMEKAHIAPTNDKNDVQIQTDLSYSQYAYEAVNLIQRLYSKNECFEIGHLLLGKK